MPPLIHCVRHAQGFHNISVENLKIPDPILTPYGERQCSELSSSFQWHSRISLIVASPLTRTLQTAILSFGPALSNGHCDQTIIAIPEAQETSALISDAGSDVEHLSKTCFQKSWPVDLSLVHDGWNNKALERWRPTYDAISRRAKEARTFIYQKICQLQEEGQESPEIVLVTHGGFLHYFTEDWEDSGVDQACRAGRPSEAQWDMPGTAWYNTEVRSYQIHASQATSDADPQLIETAESRQKRSKPPLDLNQRTTSLSPRTSCPVSRLNSMVDAMIPQHMELPRIEL